MRKLSKINLMLLATTLMLVTAPAFAQTAGQMADGVFQQLTSFGDLFMAAIFLAGIGIGAAAAFKFKAYSDNPQQTRLAIPLTYACVAAICIGLPAFLNMGRNTLFDDGAGNSMDSGTYDRITQ